ncbi:MAG: carboxypeptidase regulatory-like domain-containing protein, partial [Pirellulales bacterium]
MKWSLVFCGVWIVASGLLAMGSAGAAVLTGRVVDSAGKPVAGAEVRIWQKLPDDRGPGVSDKQVKFDGDDVLLTDAEGTFTSPDVLVGDTFARIVAEAKGTLAERSAWIEIPPAAKVVAPKIVLKRLRAVIGQVHDRKGQPISGAVVFNSGDAHERVETKTGRNGKFFLDGVPAGTVFLFAEKAGYRFTGMHLPAGKSEAAFTLVTFDETVEPLSSLPPLLSADEETALAREVLKQWLKEVRPLASDEQKFFLLSALSSIDPLEALQGVDALGIRQPGFREISRDGFLEIAAARSGELAADKLEDAIESGKQPFRIASQYANAARHLANRQRPRQLEWLEAALTYVPLVDNEALRTETLALIADTLFLIGERGRGEAILAEAEELAKTLPETSRSRRAYGLLALAAEHVDAERAVEWLGKMETDRDYPRYGAELAIRLLPERPELAEEVWNRSQAVNVLPELNDLVPLPWRPRVYLPDFCHRLALIDRPRAERVAAVADTAALRVRGQGAIALAVAEAQPAEARRILE